MKVRFKFMGSARKKFGFTDIWLLISDNATVEEALTEFEKKHGVNINLEDTSVAILVNGKRLDFVGGVKAKLKDLDEIVIMPIIAGGL